MAVFVILTVSCETTDKPHAARLRLADPIGKTLHSMHDNRQDINHPHDAEDGEEIVVEHDSEMLRTIFQQVGPAAKRRRVCSSSTSTGVKIR